MVAATMPTTVMTLLTAPAEGEFGWHEVSTRVNRVVNDDAQLVLPITDEERAAKNRSRRRPRAQDGAGGVRR